MSWIWAEGGILVVVGVLLRHALRMNRPRLKTYNGLTLLSRTQAEIYDHVVRDLEIETAILGVALNEAFEARDAGNSENAWKLVELAASAWNRLSARTVTLLGQISTYMPVARLDSPRRMLPERFKSKSMVDYVRLHETLNQFVFHSKLRFQLHLRVLRRAVETLTAEFCDLHRIAERSEVRPLELWGRLDFYFHDLDLLTKETLLALRAFVPGLSAKELTNFGADLQARSPRSSSLHEMTSNK